MRSILFVGCFYLRQGRYVIVVVCLFVCLLATLRNCERICLKLLGKLGWQWADEQMVKFWWQSASRIWIRIAPLVRHALAEVCTVPVLLVVVVFH